LSQKGHGLGLQGAKCYGSCCLAPQDAGKAPQLSKDYF